MALEQRRAARSSERERHLVRLGAAPQERQIEAEEVVILDHVGIALPHQRREALEQIALVRRPRRLEGHVEAAGVAHRDHEDPPRLRIERGRLQIDLHPMKIVVLEAAETGAAARHQVLLDRSYPVILGEILEAVDRAPEARRGAGEDRAREGASARRGEQVAVRSFVAVELLDLDERAVRAGRSSVGEAIAEARQIVEVRGEEPGPKALALAAKRAVAATPDQRLTFLIRPDGDDARVESQPNKVSSSMPIMRWTPRYTGAGQCQETRERLAARDGERPRGQPFKPRVQAARAAGDSVSRQAGTASASGRSQCRCCAMAAISPWAKGSRSETSRVVTTP